MSHIVGDGPRAVPNVDQGSPQGATPTQENRRRKPLRLQGYDYAQAGASYVTICTQQRTCLFGDVIKGEMVLNEAGQMIQQIWNDLPHHYPNVTLDAFVVMPNHVHGVLFIDDSLVGDGPRAVPILDQGPPQGATPTTLSLIDLMHRFKSLTTAKYRHGVKTVGWLPFNGKLWQQGYYDHIVRNEKDLDRIRQYIINNPLQWADDTENPDFTGDASVTSRKEQHV